MANGLRDMPWQLGNGGERLGVSERVPLAVEGSRSDYYCREGALSVRLS